MVEPSGEARASLDDRTDAARQTPRPIERDGHWCWEGELGRARFRFYGKAAPSSAPRSRLAEDLLHSGSGASGGGEDRILAALADDGLELATLRQTHSTRVVDASAGDCGEGDALAATRAGLALRVVTADCVPVLLAARGAIAAVHAGWRGLAAGILTAAVERLEPHRPMQAVIGPAIGGCCYEVGAEVADAVAARAGSRTVILDCGQGKNPHLDLRRSAALELQRAGVMEIVTFDACTRCGAERLWSYRRDGKRAGRNLALVWLER